MIRRQALILALIAVALTAFSVALSRRDSRDWRASRSRRLLPFAWQDAARATITRAGSAITIFKDTAGPDAGQWKVELPDNLSDNLNPNATESLAALATLAWRERVPGREPPAPNARNAVTLDVASTAGETVSITLGDVRDGLRAAAIDGDRTTTYGVNQNLVAFLDWPKERFRSMLLAAPGQGAKPKRITLSPAKAEENNLAVTLETRGAQWIMTKPTEWPVDENRLDILVRWIDRLRAESIAAEMTGDPGYFGFDENAAFVEAWFAAPDAPNGEIRRRVEFGAVVDGETGDGDIYVRETGRSPVFTMPKEAMAEISLDIAAEHPEAWRNFFRRRALDRIGHESPARIVIEKLLPEPVKLTIENSPDPGTPGWTGTLEENGQTRSFAVDAPDGRDQMLPLAALFTGLASLRVKNFLADNGGPDADKWTARPAWRYSLFTADGRALPGLTLYAHDATGALPGGDPYVEGETEPQEQPRPGVAAGAGTAFTIPEQPAVMETFAELSYLLCLPPYRYQSRRIVDSDVKTWTKIEITSAGEGRETTRSYRRELNDINEQWRRGGAGAEPLLDDNNRLVSLLVQLSQLRAEGFVGDVSADAEKFGLDRPAITAIVYSSSGGADAESGERPLFTLALGGGADAAGRRYARLIVPAEEGGGTESPVFLVPAQIAAALGTEYR